MTLTLTNKEDALTMALALAIAAPSEDKMQEFLEIAEGIANSGMALEQVEAAKARAEEITGGRRMIRWDDIIGGVAIFATLYIALHLV